MMSPTQAGDIVVTSIVSQRVARLPLRLAPLIAWGWLLPSDAFAQANYCNVLWCTRYEVPASSGGPIDLTPLRARGEQNHHVTYSYSVKGTNSTPISTESNQAILLSNAIVVPSLWAFEFRENYYLHYVDYTNTAPLSVISKSRYSFPAVVLSSIGRPGDDGSNGGLFHSGGYGDAGYHGASFSFSNSGSIMASGSGRDSAFPLISPVGIFARSVGGIGGSGGSSSSTHHSGGGGDGAVGGNITITNESQGLITTIGDGGHGIAAFSLGGDGGRAGNAKGDSAGRDGGVGGAGGAVTITNDGRIVTAGAQAFGITAHSLGGTGGNGASSGGGLLAGHSGSGGLGASGGAVTITNTGSIVTAGIASLGLYGVSTGGNGGDGASAKGAFYALGGSGGDGGNGGAVIARQPGSILTSGDRATGIHVQSIGGGGRGGDASSFGLFSSVAIGGTGGNGGAGNTVEAHLLGSGLIVTQGRDAAGIMAQSIGGGGGSAGDARAVSVGVGFSAAAAVGGSGGDGGSGGLVTVTTEAGTSISTGTAQAPAASAAQGSAATPVDPPLYSIQGHHSFGILAQSVGGGGGQGGRATSASAAVGGPDLPAASASVAIGGSGANAGHGAAVNVTNGGAITTFAAKSDGVVAQSVGGGGGSGGNTMSVAAAAAPVAITATVDLGGTGGGGGSGAGVTVTTSGSIRTLSGQSVGVVAQSIGGGGGSGGSVTSVEATLGKNSVNATVDLGGKGGAGGHGSAASATNTGAITTIGQQSFGMLVQSVGGGGGHGGSVHDYAVSIAAGSAEQKSGGTDVSGTVNVGGKGGSGGQGQAATITQSGSIFTAGDLAHGAVVQSIGGGGGTGGSVFSLSVGAAVAQPSQGGGDPAAQQLNASVSIGGKGGSGSSGGTVTFTSTAASTVTTLGDQAYGVLAQSVGGGGGNGGDAKSLSVTLVAPTNGTDVIDEAKKSLLGNAFGYVSGTFAKPAPSMGVPAKSLSATASVGGDGGRGNVGGAVTVTLDTTSSITTYGSQSHGVFAQSIGGGGGSGGAANTLSVAPVKTNTLSVTVGGAGGSGNKGGTVTLNEPTGASTVPTGKISTLGHGAAGIFAQSVGGGGGSGGVATDKAMSLPLVSGKSLTVGLGGKGGDGSDGGTVSVTRSAAIETSGHNAVGIFAQSIGGGGGSGHYVGEGDAMGLLTLSMGGSGGSNGGSGGTASVTNSGAITTKGPLGHAILAQSVGGGGGLTDLASSSVKAPGIPTGPAVAMPHLTLSLGNSSGPSAGDGGAVKVDNTGALATTGNHAYGILAQSISGGGGILHAGNAANMVDPGAAITVYSTESGRGGDVTVTAGPSASGGGIATSGIAAHAIFVQSVGGGGGLGLIDSDIAPSLSAAAGEAKKGAGRAGDISITSSAALSTRGDYGAGILAHSGSFGSVLTATNQGYAASWSPSQLGGFKTGSGTVTINQTGSIVTQGRAAHGIHVLSNGFSAKAADVTIGAATGVAGTFGTTIRTAGAGASGLRIENVPAFSPAVAALAAAGAPPVASVSATVTSDALIDLRRNGNAAIAIDIANPMRQSALTIAGSVLTGDANGLDPARAAVRFASAGEIAIQSSGLVAGAVTGPEAATGLLANLTVAGTLRGTVTGIANYSLSQGGTHYAPVDFTPGRVVVDVGSVTSAAGAFRPFMTRFGSVSAAGQPYALLRTSDASASSVGVSNALATTYGVDQVSTGASTSLVLRSATVSFSKAPIDGKLLPAAGMVDAAVARWVNGAGVAPADESLHGNLLAAANASTVGEVSKPLKALDASIYQNVPTQHAAAGARHVGTMLSCGVSGGNYAAIREGDCSWASATGAFARTYSEASTSSDLGLVLGRQSALDDNWRVGIGAGYDLTNTRGLTLNGDGHRLHLGGTLKYTQGPWLAALALSGAYGWENVSRPIDLATGPLKAVSERHMASAVARLRLARLFSLGPLDVTTMIDLDATYLRSFGFSERNAGAWDMTVKSSDTVALGIHPSVRLGYDFNYSDGIVVRPFLEAGLRINATQGRSTISFRESTILTDGIAIDHKMDRLVGTFGAGVSIFSKGNIETKLVYSGAASKGSISHAGLLKVGLTF